MTKVITFSRVFPAYHPKAGQPTYFIEKFYNSIYPHYDWSEAPHIGNEYVIELDTSISNKKHHTIRVGHRFKVGDKFSPRIWSGKPYNSPQIIIAPDIEVKKVWDFEVKFMTNFNTNKTELVVYMPTAKATTTISRIAKNDGLSLENLQAWFNKPFTGQIICWNNEIEY